MKTTIDFIEVGPGDRIAVLSNLKHDRAKGNVIIVPPFGKSAKDLFIFAYYLWSSGWNVFRFDARDHVGLSSGEIQDFTLSSLLTDLDLVCERLRENGHDRPVLQGISLSVPVLLKFAAVHPTVRSVVSVVGAVDVGFAIEQASGDVLAQYREAWPNRKRFQSLLGYDVSAEAFVSDMDGAGFAPLESLLADVRLIACPIHLLMAEEDAWVEPESVLAVHQAAPEGSTLTRIEGLTHEFGRSIRMAKLICLEVCRLCNLADVDTDQGDVFLPNFAEILRASSAEAEALDAFSRSDCDMTNTPASVAG